MSTGLSHRGFSLGDSDQGILNLILVQTPLFGKFLVSLPYINSAGVSNASDKSAHQLVSDACELADRLDVKYLELRHESPVHHPSLNYQRTDKFHMRLELPSTAELLDRTFKSKLRSQVRKADQAGHEVLFGGHELLDSFYDIFAVNMRDLGTPVFSKKLFKSILEEFSSDAEICVVVNKARPVAAALLVHSRNKTEVPSASCLRTWNHTGANMWMYRHLLRRAIERGSNTFDFGRSSMDSGTYRFKKQWGAAPYPATWQYYVRQGSVEDMRPESATNQRLIRVWKKLPVWGTRLIGPSIVRGIP